MQGAHDIMTAPDRLGVDGPLIQRPILGSVTSKSEGAPAAHSELTYIWVIDMYFCMRTTLDLDDDLLRAVKQRAAETGRTITSLVESALRELLRLESEPPTGYRLQWTIVEGGAQPGVDLTDRDALLERMEGRS